MISFEKYSSVNRFEKNIGSAYIITMDLAKKFYTENSNSNHHLPPFTVW